MTDLSPSGIPMHGALTVQLPPGPAFLSPLLASLRDLARLLGFPREETSRLELALEEAFVALAPDPAPGEVEVRFRRVPLGLRVTLGGHRSSLSRQDLSSYVPGDDPEEDGGRGLGLYMLLHLTDQVTLTEGTENRQELHLFKRLPLLPPQPATPPHPRIPEEIPLPREVRRLEPREGRSLSREEGLPPLPWGELLADPGAALFAACAPGGRILALQGWERHEDRPTLGVAGPRILLPGVPEGPCAPLLDRALEDQARREGQGGLLAIHPLGDPASPPEGFRPCALLPFTPPRPFAPDRTGPCALLFRPLGPAAADLPGLSPRDRDLLAPLGLLPHPASTPPGREDLAPRSVLSVTTQVGENRAELRVHAYGPDFPLRLRELTAHLRERDYRHLLLHLPLERAATAFEAEAARREGYVPVGFLPGTPGGAELLALHRCGLPLPEGAGEALCPSLAAHLRREGGAPA